MILFGKKHHDLQPWLEYFGVLKAYEDAGYLQMLPEKNEAFITAPALYALSTPEASADEEQSDEEKKLSLVKDVPKTLRRIRAYSAWKSRTGILYMSRPFALNVVKPDVPHDPLYTLVIASNRPWWNLWQWNDNIDIIEYRT